MKHVMLDLETLGTVPGCVILSIGAVEFDPEQEMLGREFYAVIDQQSCEDVFLAVSESTLNWWQGQSPEARMVLTHATSGVAGPLSTTLDAFNAWLMELGPAKALRLYGNGADFDNPILACAYDAAGVKPFFPAYAGRCYRTLKNLEELFGPTFMADKITREHGVHHNALDDAKAQAVHLMRNVARIRRYYDLGGVEG